jgi:hypothetical protein
MGTWVYVCVFVCVCVSLDYLECAFIYQLFCSARHCLGQAVVCSRTVHPFFVRPPVRQLRIRFSHKLHPLWILLLLFYSAISNVSNTHEKSHGDLIIWKRPIRPV